MASYPSQVATFQTHVNITEIIDASHPNNIQSEVVAVEAAIGVNPATSTTPSPSGTFTASSTAYSTVKDRLANIETGIVSDAHSQYLRKAGDSANVITPNSTSVKGLVIKAAPSQSANLQEWQTSGGTPVTYIDNAGNLIGTASGDVHLSTFTTAGDLLIGTGSGAASRLGIGSANTALVSNGTTATWTTPTDATKIPLSTVTTAGDLIVGTGSGTVSRLGIGANGSALVSNGTSASWTTPTDTTKIPLSTVTTNGDLIVGTGSGSVSRLGVGTSSQALIGGASPTWGQITSAMITAVDGGTP
jgi:hypothetical protein